MRNQETGEFELVIGNKQLLSAFFIVVLLFAVAFAMGYVVGQNAPRSTKAANDTIASVPSSEAARPAPLPYNPPAVKTADPPAEQPAASQPAASDARPEPVTKPAQSPDAPAAAPAAASTEPPPAAPGSYWQVIAIAQPDAQVIYQALKDKGFPAWMSPGPNGLVRVLVGPYSDTQTMGKAKTDLENAGFPHPFRK